jgi:thioesterase domain-containing protein
VLFRATFPGDKTLPGYDFTNGWCNLFARGLDVVQGTGDHLSVHDEQHLAALAREINAVLDRHGSGK